jgi:hypothetical protein
MTSFKNKVQIENNTILPQKRNKERKIASGVSGSDFIVKEFN